jgi:archaellum component FlaF (FlaF/FlaG flagellin family)
MNNNDSSKVKLYVYEEPLGKSMAAKTVSDNPNDLRNSVYSKAAALERKIQILYYDYTKQQALEAEADSTPIVKFVSDSVNYGKLSKQTTNAFTINFTNAGNYPLRISDITSDCNCIRFYWDEKLIVPGENSKINLLIITDEKQGKQKATLKIDLLPKKSISFPLYFEGVK